MEVLNLKFLPKNKYFQDKIGLSIRRSLYRRKMKLHWDSKSYGQRWQVETVFSMIKRNLTDSLRSKDYWSQIREVFLLAITHNLLIVLFLFQRAFLQSKYS